MKPLATFLAALALASPLPGQAPKPADGLAGAISIQARFTQTGTGGAEDILSAPSITVLPEQEATVEVVREHSVNLGTVKRVYPTGISLEVKASPTGDDSLLLSGLLTIREQESSAPASIPDGVWALVHAMDVPFVLRMKFGEARELSLPKRNDQTLRIQITARKSPPANAALSYWKAFAALPKLTDAQRKLLSPTSPVNTPETKAMLTTASTALEGLQEAVKIRHCDWQNDYSKGTELPLAMISPARDLAKLACLRARLSASEGNWVGAVEDVSAVLTLARHIGADPLFICMLVDFSIESSGIDTAVAFLPKLPPEQLQSLASAWKALPQQPQLSEAMKAERVFMETGLKSRLSAAATGDAAALTALWGEFQAAGNLTPAQVSRLKKADAAFLHRALDQLWKDADELATLAALDLPKRSKAFQDFDARIAKDLKNSPERVLTSALLTPVITKTADAFAVAAVREALFSAALAYCSDGETKTGEIKDPAEDGPFKLAKTDGGFILTSAYLYKGKAMSLRAGQ